MRCMQRMTTKRKYLLLAVSAAGLIIGISIMAAVLGLMDGGRKVLRNAYWHKGINIYEVSPENGMEAATIDFFSENDKQIKREMPEIKAIMEVMEAKGTIKSYKDRRTVSIVGTGEEYAELYNVRLLSGRFITKEDIENKRQVVVIDDITAYKLFEKTGVVGRSIDLDMGNGETRFNIIGVVDNYNKNLRNLYTKKIDGVGFMPQSSFKDTGAGAVSTRIVIFADKAMNTVEFQNRTEHFFDRHGLGMPETEKYVQLKEVSEFMDDAFITLILISVLSFILGVICCTYAMLLLVANNNKEIAMSLFYGAGYAEIGTDIVYGSMLVALCSGAAGLVLGVICGNVIGSFLNIHVYPSFNMLAAVLGMCVIAGFAAVLYPLAAVKKIDVNGVIWE